MKWIPFITLIIFAGCFTFKADREYLTGEWTDFVKDPAVVTYWEGDETIITFKDDSFYYKEVRSDSDMLSSDPCNFLRIKHGNLKRHLHYIQSKA